MDTKIIKKYISRGKFVTIVSCEQGYCFRIQDKCTKRDYYSNTYDSFHLCEKDSYKVVKAI